MTRRWVRLICAIPLLAALAAATGGANSRGHSVNGVKARPRQTSTASTLPVAQSESNSASDTRDDHVRVETTAARCTCGFPPATIPSLPAW